MNGGGIRCDLVSIAKMEDPGEASQTVGLSTTQDDKAVLLRSR